MWLGLKLALKGNKETYSRLIATTVGIALSSALLFLLIGGVNGLDARAERGAWLYTTSTSGEIAPLLWNRSFYGYDERSIDVITLAATGPSSPVPPGILGNPDSGEYYVSPALADLIESVPQDQLGNRFAGEQVGIISEEALQSPDSLIAIQGRDASVLRASPSTIQVFSIATDLLPQLQGFSIMLGIGAIGLFFPIFVFISASTHLGAAMRDQRYAALRLIGATPRQVNRFAAIESGLTAGIGGTIGFMLYLLLRPVAANFSIGGESFFLSDLYVAPLLTIALLLAISAVAALGAYLSLRGVNISPLGVSRHGQKNLPKMWRVLPLLFGIILLVLTLLTQSWGFTIPANLGQPMLFGSFAIILFGIVFAGPWLTRVATTLFARHAKSASALIASRRIADNLSAIFRSVSGVVLALFMVSLFFGAAGSYLKENEENTNPGTFQSDMVEVSFVRNPLELEKGNALIGALQRVSGVEHVVPVYPVQTENASKKFSDDGIVSCRGVEQLELGSCEGGTGGYAKVPAVKLLFTEVTPREWQRADISENEVGSTAYERMFIRTDGQQDSIERVRTVVRQQAPLNVRPVTFTHINSEGPLIKELQNLAYVGIIISFLISAASLAVAVVAGVLERRRSFSILRLAGTPMSTLQKVVFFEAVIPLLIVSVFSAGLGFLVAGLLLNALDQTTLHPPSMSYYIVVGASLIAALGILTMTLPLMRKLTDFDRNRFE